MKIERPRGTRDFLPEEMEKRRAVEKVMRRIAESYGYREVMTPTFEHSELFKIKSGEEIVKEMYVFLDKGGREMALRPELTAPVVRMFLDCCEVLPKPLRFYYFSNCFRYERPQRGRFREFWQFGAELIGSNSCLAEAEVISLAYEILKALKVEFELKIGHVGIMRKVLSGIENSEKIMHLIDKKDVENLLSEMERLEVPKDVREKVLMLMDLKGDLSILEDVKIEEADRLKKLAEVLEDYKVKYKLDLGIVRGLDYYTGVVFEFYSEKLGAQKQICGGGSYELASLFGGKETPATGFAIGFDRVCEICEVDLEKRVKVVVVSFKETYSKAIEIAKKLREKDLIVIIDVMDRSVKKQLSFANDISADFALIVGGRELEAGEVLIKNLRSGEQFGVKISDLSPALFVK
ncbi:MAG: histidine--tRNA ligase [Archaeoglobaceae archaeon]|nr:histidine--tRNA ligase [Archaeoglobaceae archaeon]MCX8151906.1 histidine--tRNA ligase [Archaeoglobaceae archaeon]MDW8013295.1 histidine--tRNA ligase [Archaeoglobaceae archaeon]